MHTAEVAREGRGDCHSRQLLRAAMAARHRESLACSFQMGKMASFVLRMCFTTKIKKFVKETSVSSVQVRNVPSQQPTNQQTTGQSPSPRVLLAAVISVTGPCGSHPPAGLCTWWLQEGRRTQDRGNETRRSKAIGGGSVSVPFSASTHAGPGDRKGSKTTGRVVCE